ncbi:MAG: hypothetical protein QNJ97_00960 [Myxococcota bacterium]|nr:hypothetical protein [Myxococcota bacterium]
MDSTSKTLFDGRWKTDTPKKNKNGIWTHKEEYLGSIYVKSQLDPNTAVAVDTDLVNIALRNSEGNGVIWMASRGIPDEQDPRDFDAFFAHYADTLVVEDPMIWGDFNGYRPIGVQNHIVRVHKDDKVAIDGKMFPSRTFELIDIQKWIEGKDYVKQKIKIVLADDDRKVEKAGAKSKPDPYLLIFGYADKPKQFEKDLSVFERFLGQIRREDK